MAAWGDVTVAGKLPSAKRLRELFTYCPEAGQLLWKETRAPNVPAGSVAGFLRKDSGVWSIMVDGRMYAAHSLVWKFVHGKNPPGPLMHINGHLDDNRIENLRPIKGARGPYTLDQIRDQCDVVGDCWHWKGGKSGKAPAIRHEGKVVNVRRYVFTELLGGKVITGRMVSMSCDSLDCVAPDHLSQYTRQQLQARTAKRTQYGASLARAMKLAQQKQARSKLTWDDVRRIREADGTVKSIAHRFGIPPSTAAAIRRGDTWREAAANPFFGLLAA